ncbi:MAG TPA: zinc dependent phospholipase C family protein [Vicinamibacterales bacterium]|nr:zinc dependent phospholipase C family protein [Vicinamibacterales bacterium]
MERLKIALAAGALAALLSPRDAGAYSVLAHEANIDALWDRAIAPLLQRRFPGATREEVRDARAYAYGGSVIQDLGYYPFGTKFFSNLLHYVRSGDFVEFALRDAKNVDEYAFALGALGHYASDNTGHPEAVNKAVALMFPKLRRKFGKTVTYVDSPASHVIVEFSFDIVQAAAGAYLPESYHQFIGFKVSKPLLERAFRETYSLEIKDIFAGEDLAIATYRKSVSEIIPEMTRTAWRDKREEIARLTPGIERSAFVYGYSRRDFEREFGSDYRKPGSFARFVAFIYRLLPKIGPLKPLSFRTPTPEAERLFADSFKDTRARFAASLDAVGRGRLDLPNTDFDTGKPAAHGEYALADDTYAELLRRLAKNNFAGVSRGLRKDIEGFYAAAPNRTASRKERHHAEEIRQDLDALRHTAPR